MLHARNSSTRASPLHRDTIFRLQRCAPNARCEEF
jgi:hypothetical protein